MIYNLSTSKSEPDKVVISAGSMMAEPFYWGKNPLIYKGAIEYLSSVGTL